MHISEKITNLDINNLLSGLLGVLVGSGITIWFSFKLAKRNEVFQTQSREKDNVANAIALVVQLSKTYRSYQPNLLRQSGFGIRLSEDYKESILQAIDVYHAAQQIQYLLPKSLRKRWDLMLILVSEFSNCRDLEEIQLGRASEDVFGYIRYVTNSLADFMDDLEIRGHLERPYLRRDDPESWSE
jgi:hypothetical protein